MHAFFYFIQPNHCPPLPAPCHQQANVSETDGPRGRCNTILMGLSAFCMLNLTSCIIRQDLCTIRYSLDQYITNILLACNINWQPYRL
jgi:hypothetical protein